MRNMDDSAPQGSYFPTNPGVAAMSDFNKMLGTVVPDIQQARIAQTPLWKVFGAAGPDDERIPEQMRPFAGMTMGRIGLLGHVFGQGGLKGMMAPTGPQVFMDPNTGQITVSPGSGQRSSGAQPQASKAPAGPAPAQPMAAPSIGNVLGNAPAMPQTPMDPSAEPAPAPMMPQGMPPAGPQGAPQGAPQTPQFNPSVRVPGLKGKQLIDAVINQNKPKPMTAQGIGAIADRVEKGDVAYLKSLSGFGANSPRSLVVQELANRGVDLTGKDVDLISRQAYARYVNSNAFQMPIKLLDSVGPNMDTVLNLSAKIDRTNFKLLNRGILLGLTHTGDPQTASFAAASLEVMDQVAKILQGSGGTSDKKIEQAGQIFSADFSADQLVGVVGTMKELLDSRKAALIHNTRMTENGMAGTKSKPIVDPAVRFNQLIGSGKSEADAYKAMRDEGYRRQ